MNFRKKVIKNELCVLNFSTTFVRKISNSKKTWKAYYYKYKYVFVYSTGYSGQILMKLEFSRQMFERDSDFMKIRPVRTELFHVDGRVEGRTDRQTIITNKMHTFYINVLNYIVFEIFF
jgi:hypothetical protein